MKIKKGYEGVVVGLVMAGILFAIIAILKLVFGV